MATIKETEELERKQRTALTTKKSQRRNFTLPWWFKIIGYLLSFALTIVSLFFIIVTGINFGDEKCRKWLTSFLVSILTSVLLTQPIQVALLSIFFVFLLRKKDQQDRDIEYDHLDDGKPLNKFQFVSKTGEEEVDRTRTYVETPNCDIFFQQRKEKQMEKKAWSLIKKTAVYCIYLLVLFNVSTPKLIFDLTLTKNGSAN